MRRGACPTLAAPMRTGDGWLARLVPEAPISAGALGGLARAAARFGNGRIEVTVRGGLQIRGLAEGAGGDLGAALADLGITPRVGLSVLTGVLAGRDRDEIADPRPVAAAIRAGAAGFALGPKVSVLVDGGGALGLGGLGADARLRAVPTGWRFSAGGRDMGVFKPEAAVAGVLDLLARLAREDARARDLFGPETLGAMVAPVGRFALRDGAALGLGLPFGQIESAVLKELAAAAGGGDFLPAPGRGLMVSGAGAALETAAARLGFVTDPGDPALAITACAGRPGCGSAHLATRDLGRAVAARAEWRGEFALHLSGCAKCCGQPAGRGVTLMAGPEGCEILGRGMAVPGELAEILRDCAGRVEQG